MAQLLTTFEKALARAQHTITNLADDIGYLTERGDNRLNGMLRVKMLKDVRDKLKAIELPTSADFDEETLSREVEIHQYTSKRITRAQRRDNAVNALNSIHRILEGRYGPALPRARIRAAIIQLNELEFPKYYLKI